MMRLWIRTGFAAIGFGLGALSPGCDKHKDMAAETFATTPVADLKPAPPADTLAALSRPATRPGTIQAGDWLRISVE
jgi:hypothetical protein